MDCVKCQECVLCFLHRSPRVMCIRIRNLLQLLNATWYTLQRCSLYACSQAGFSWARPRTHDSGVLILTIKVEVLSLRMSDFHSVILTLRDLEADNIILIYDISYSPRSIKFIILIPFTHGPRLPCKQLHRHRIHSNSLMNFYTAAVPSNELDSRTTSMSTFGVCRAKLSPRVSLRRLPSTSKYL